VRREWPYDRRKKVEQSPATSALRHAGGTRPKARCSRRSVGTGAAVAGNAQCACEQTRGLSRTPLLDVQERASRSREARTQGLIAHWRCAASPLSASNIAATRAV